MQRKCETLERDTRQAQQQTEEFEGKLRAAQQMLKVERDQQREFKEQHKQFDAELKRRDDRIQALLIENDRLKAPQHVSTAAASDRSNAQHQQQVASMQVAMDRQVRTTFFLVAT